MGPQNNGINCVAVMHMLVMLCSRTEKTSILLGQVHLKYCVWTPDNPFLVHCHLRYFLDGNLIKFFFNSYSTNLRYEEQLKVCGLTTLETLKIKGESNRSV